MWEATDGGAEQAVLWAVGLAALVITAWWILSVTAWTLALRHDQLRKTTNGTGTNGRTRQPGSWAMPGSLRAARALLGPIVFVAGLATACTGGGEADVPTLVWVDEQTTVPPTALPTLPPTTLLPSAASPSSEATGPPPTENHGSTHPGLIEPQLTRHIVVAGDHLWSIAADHLTRQTGSKPTSQQVASYWRQLIEQNRANLFSGQPDVIHPGEVLVLP